MNEIQFLVTGLVAWFVKSFLIKFVKNYNELSAEAEGILTKVVFIQIDVECHNNLWYGWYVSDTQEAFVAQGTTYDEAVQNCKTTLEKKNPEFKIVLRIEKKQNDHTVIQNQRERDLS